MRSPPRHSQSLISTMVRCAIEDRPCSSPFLPLWQWRIPSRSGFTLWDEQGEPASSRDDGVSEQSHTLPLDFPAAVVAALGPRVDAGGAVPVGGGQHILILDDESPLVRMATRVLERKGYRVTGFSHVGDALDAVHAFPEAFDLLMVDFNMPGATGVAVAREVWTRRPGLPVLMVSGRLSDAEMAEVAAIGIHRTLAKPYSTDDLCAAVHDLLTHASTQTPE